MTETRSKGKPNKTMEEIVSLCKRRGYLFQSSEIYGGLNSCWDYGPLGVELKRNVKEAWWKRMVRRREDIVGLDSSILMHPSIWKASGHLANFTDPLVDCKVCKGRFRADHIATSQCPKKPSKCPGEHSECDLTEPRMFNLMFKTFLGPVESDSAVVYLRPETAQGIFVNFQNVQRAARAKLPFGIAQIGKAFRNEITPGNFTFRTREFEQMEIEYFVMPGTENEHYETWKKTRFDWYVELGMRPSHLRLREHGSDELAHYARGCADIEYLFPFDWSELEGIANRTDYDLKCHQAESGKDLTYFIEEEKKHVVPYVIEPSAGADRGTLAFLLDAYEQEGDRTVLRLHPELAPVQVGVFPLVKKDGMPEKSREVMDLLLDHSFAAFYDESGAIGRRYRRQDEIGTPYGVTVDSDTIADGTVTLRLRDDMSQTRVKIQELPGALREATHAYKRVDRGVETP